MTNAYDHSHIATIESVMENIKTYITNPASLAMIMKAYDVAKEKHSGQFRKSGEPYIQHPLEIVNILANLHVGPSTLCAGFLHDVVEDTDTDIDYIKKEFNDDIAGIVDGLTKISKLKYLTAEKALAKTHQKILLAMAKDVRVILVKIVDRLHNMRTISAQPHDKQVRIAKETLDLYAPLAHRLGMYRIKSELEDLSYAVINPEQYNHVADLISSQRKVREDDISKMEQELNSLLAKYDIKDYEISGRIKTIYSVCKKMETKHLDFDQIYDLLALRILVNTVEECYKVLGIVHGQWSPLPKRFKDYIAIPKPNLYQSLHTTIIGPNGKFYEIQIRTHEMDKIAEYGIAAHWAYKENSNYIPKDEQLQIFNELKWYKELLTYAEQGEQEDNDPLSSIQRDIFSANVYVFTPKGDVYDFPKGATPLDFAYRIHTEVGNHAVGATANGKIVPLTYPLKTGDVVEIKTNKNLNGPVENWLKICKTSHAKHKITTILNKQKRDDYIQRGKEEHAKFCKMENVPTDSVLYKLSDKFVEENFAKINVHSQDDLFYEIGKGTISLRNLYTKFVLNEVLDDESLIRSYNEQKTSQQKPTNNSSVIVDGFPKAHVKFANCCHPVYGDPIVGYVSKGNGIIIHRMECHNALHNAMERRIDCFWNPDTKETTYESIIHILSYNRKNIVADMINMLNGCGVYIISISSSVNKNGDLLTKVKVKFKNTDMVENCFANLYKVSDVYEIIRVIK